MSTVQTLTKKELLLNAHKTLAQELNGQDSLTGTKIWIGYPNDQKQLNSLTVPALIFYNFGQEDFVTAKNGITQIVQDDEDETLYYEIRERRYGATLKIDLLTKTERGQRELEGQLFEVFENYLPGVSRDMVEIPIKKYFGIEVPETPENTRLSIKFRLSDMKYQRMDMAAIQNDWIDGFVQFDYFIDVEELSSGSIIANRNFELLPQ